MELTPSHGQAKEDSPYRLGEPGERVFKYFNEGLQRAIIANYEKLFGDLGELHVIGIQVISDGELMLMAHVKKGGAMITVKESEQQKGRLASVSFRF